ncbi:MAG TPA: thiamine-phosphate kinase [Miltoncostaeaceae bacterium]|nr:thiamine-phosphate kinase [Miltoncostaeaceae bacterium]
MSDDAISERAGIALIRAAVDAYPGTELGIGDDAAILSLGERALACHDLLIDGVHFRRAHASLASIGHKAVAVNLSDIAAMGGRPRALLVGLVVPPEGLSAEELGELYAGMRRACEPHGVTIAGGDTTRGPALMLAVTLLGELPPGAPALTRAGARAGDLLCVSGPLGAAAAGLLVLEGTVERTCTPHADALIDAQLCPRARLEDGRELARAGARAGMDISDGLALDAGRLAEHNGLAAVIDLDLVPLADGVSAVATAAGRDPALFAATGGEDYELLVAVAPQDHAQIARGLARPLSIVGRLTDGSGVRLERAGRAVDARMLGWESP